jgi:membrane-associated phospholipid phosphatase
LKNNPFRSLGARLAPNTYLGVHVAVGLVLCAAGISIFGTLLSALLDNSAMVKVDAATVDFIHARMTSGLMRIVSATTQFGGPIAMTALGIIGAIVLWRAKQRIILLGWVAAFVGGTLIDQVLKRVIHRSRPPEAAGIVHAGSFSFPSGHAMGSMIGYGMVIWVLFLFWHPRRLSKFMIHGVAGLLVIAIGVSRILIGAHYPSDVAGGWAAAIAWLAVCITGVNIVRRRPGGDPATFDLTNAHGP